jgi:hypothetical protein
MSKTIIKSPLGVDLIRERQSDDNLQLWNGCKGCYYDSGSEKGECLSTRSIKCWYKVFGKDMNFIFKPAF